MRKKWGKKKQQPAESKTNKKNSKEPSSNKRYDHRFNPHRKTFDEVGNNELPPEKDSNYLQTLPKGKGFVEGEGFFAELIINHYKVVMISFAVIIPFVIVFIGSGSLQKSWKFTYMFLGFFHLPIFLYHFYFFKGTDDQMEHSLRAEEFKKKYAQLSHIPLAYDITFFLFLLFVFGVLWGTVYVSRPIVQMMDQIPGGMFFCVLFAGLLAQAIMGLPTALFEIFFETNIEMGARSVPTYYRKSSSAPKTGHKRILFFAIILVICAGLLIMGAVLQRP